MLNHIWSVKQRSHQILGSIASARFQPIHDSFSAWYTKGYDTRSQLCVYIKGEKVVDLHGRPKDDARYDADSLAPIFSSGKSIASILMAIMHSQGRLQYDEPVSAYWPEFAANGKEHITVADVLRHEAGLYKLSGPIDWRMFLTKNIK